MPRRGHSDQRRTAAPPVVSVIVPVKDTPPHLLVRAVGSVADQDCDAHLEVVLMKLAMAAFVVGLALGLYLAVHADLVFQECTATAELAAVFHV